MVSIEVAERAFKAAQAQAHKHKPGHLFRVPGFPGVYSDGMMWVIDVTERTQDWRVKGQGNTRLIKARWPA